MLCLSLFVLYCMRDELGFVCHFSHSKVKVSDSKIPCRLRGIGASRSPYTENCTPLKLCGVCGRIIPAIAA